MVHSGLTEAATDFKKSILLFNRTFYLIGHLIIPFNYLALDEYKLKKIIQNL